MRSRGRDTEKESSFIEEDEKQKFPPSIWRMPVNEWDVNPMLHSIRDSLASFFDRRCLHIGPEFLLMSSWADVQWLRGRCDPVLGAYPLYLLGRCEYRSSSSVDGKRNDRTWHPPITPFSDPKRLGNVAIRATSSSIDETVERKSRRLRLGGCWTFGPCGGGGNSEAWECTTSNEPTMLLPVWWRRRRMNSNTFKFDIRHLSGDFAYNFPVCGN